MNSGALGFAVVVAMGLMTLDSELAEEGKGFKARFDATARAQADAKRRLTEGLEGKTTDAAQQPLIDRFHAETAGNLAKVLKLVRECPRDPGVVAALQFVIVTAGRGPGDEAYRAMECLLREHVRDAGMGDVCGRIFHFVHAPVAESLLRCVLATHPDHRDRGLACMSLAEYMRMRAVMVRRVRGGQAKVENYVHEPFLEVTRRLIAEADPEALDREADALLERVVAEFGDVNDWFTPRRTIGAIAAGELFAARNLTVGKVAPDIRAQDQDGKPFALSDYRGKVVVLTFSANWCGPCVGMYPEERELVKEHAGEPFAVVSVNEDDDVATLKKAIATGQVTWRCWWDGGMDGPITTRWGIVGIPAIFVLDRTGTIRFKDVRGDDLKKAVSSLLNEMPGETTPGR
jgi:thiol-disulfide isomerase/thioredoxin